MPSVFQPSVLFLFCARICTRSARELDEIAYESVFFL